MNQFRLIREKLGATQAAIAAEIGVTQGNVSFYERGQTVPPDVARKLIAYANSKGLPISFDHVYGDGVEIAKPAPKPRRKAEQQKAA